MPSGAGRLRGHGFAEQVEHPAAPDRAQQERQLDRHPEHRRPEVADRRRDRAARPERHVFERAAILPQRHLIVGAAVDVVERDAGRPALGEPPKVGDVQDARG